MLRTSIRSARSLGRRPNVAVVGRQWQAASAVSRRSFADKKTEASQPVILPGSETNTTERTEPPSPLEPKPAIPVDAVPLTPPKPDITIQTTIPKTASTPPPPPPAATPLPRKKGFFRRLRNLVLTLAVLGALGFGGGVWYSRVNDNFHDFFTEYVPYGEQAVLYLEEMDFRKRFSSVSEKINRPRDTAAPVKIPAQSGASWRVADSGEPTTRQSSSAVDKAKAAVAGAAAPKEEKKKVEEPVKAAPAPAPEAPKAAAPAPVAEAKVVPAAAVEPEFKAPEVNEPSRFPPIAPISPLTVNDAVEPVVQDLVHMLNGIIAVINADKAQGSYGSTIEKAKGDLNKVGGKIKDIKAAVEKKAAEQVRAKVEDFDAAAGDLVKRVEAAMAAQEANWRAEFEQEMKRVRESYDDRVKLVLEREQQLNEERLNNRLLDQAIALKKDFIAEVQKRVEEERDGRLGKLDSLSAAVADLEKLTTGWNDVVDASQQTQQLHVAVEAVRASIDNAQHPRPFIRELVALKEIASSDPVVDAAIASINPTAYQRGLPTTSQLVERFRGVANEVRKASLLSEDAGVASHASSYILSKVMFKKQGLAAGDDVESILTRTQTHLEEGDLDAAAREINGLQGWAKTLSKDWLGEVRKVLEVQQALDVSSSPPEFEL
jgi:mitofilin